MNELLENIVLIIITIFIMLLVGYIAFSSSNSRLELGIAALYNKGKGDEDEKKTDDFLLKAGKSAADERESYFKYE